MNGTMGLDAVATPAIAYYGAYAPGGQPGTRGAVHHHGSGGGRRVHVRAAGPGPARGRSARDHRAGPAAPWR